MTPKEVFDSLQADAAAVSTVEGVSSSDEMKVSTDDEDNKISRPSTANTSRPDTAVSESASVTASNLNDNPGAAATDVTAQTLIIDDDNGGPVPSEEVKTPEHHQVDTHKYVGDWRRGKFHGRGVQTSSTNHVYEGEFYNARRHVI